MALSPILTDKYSNEYPGAVLKIRPKHQRKKLPWYDYLFIVVSVVIFDFLRGWLSGAGLSPLIVIFGTLVVCLAAGYLASRVGRLLSHRFPALKSEHVGYFDRR